MRAEIESLPPAELVAGAEVATAVLAGVAVPVADAAVEPLTSVVVVVAAGADDPVCGTRLLIASIIAATSGLRAGREPSLRPVFCWSSSPRSLRLARETEAASVDAASSLPEALGLWR